MVADQVGQAVLPQTAGAGADPALDQAVGVEQQPPVGAQLQPLRRPVRLAVVTGQQAQGGAGQLGREQHRAVVRTEQQRRGVAGKVEPRVLDGRTGPVGAAGAVGTVGAV